jgi:signal transduction histidine kinase
MDASWFMMGLTTGLLLAIPFSLWIKRRESIRFHRLETRNRASERLAELGKLTSGLAHEIKNPLSSVNLNVQLLQEDLRELASSITPPHQQNPPSATDTLPEQLGRIQRRFHGLLRETQRLRDILEDFLRFAGRVKLDRTPLEINTLADELADFFTPQAQAAQIQCRTQLTPEPTQTLADNGLLKQALLNLLINATQAMTNARSSPNPHGGCNELILRTNVTHQAGHHDIHIHVIDTGPGIQPSDLEKVFEPYFTTKKAGTGLGLPTAKRIVEEHRGSLTVHSELGRGSDFTITLPIEPPSDPPTPP